jgi:Carboxypeptidase regulatory-like domain
MTRGFGFGWLNSLLRLSLIFVVATATAQTSSKVAASAFSITGVVVNSSTGAPVARCHVTATHTERVTGGNRRGGSQQGAADTDERGHFVLALASDGTWALRASAKGYRSQAYDEHQGFFTSVVLSERAPTYDVLFRLAPDSSITGVVLDEGSEPVRQAQLSAFRVPSPDAGGVHPAPARAGSAMTDDRGRYELSGMAPGDYRVSVQARPWYAAGAQGRPQTPDATQLDPSLDMVYPVTWFPGATDEHSAGIVTLHDGESREADIQLVPMPSIHLHISGQPPAPSGSENFGRVGNPIRFPQVERVSNGGGNIGPISNSIAANGSFEFSGLSPGLYRIRAPEENGQPGAITLLEITANSSRYLDMASAALPTATVTLKIEGGPGAESLPIIFTDVNDRENVFRSNAGGRDGGGFQGGGIMGGFAGSPPMVQSVSPPMQQQGGQRPQRGGPGSDSPRRERPARTIELPPGRYSVTQESSANFSLTGMALGANEIAGRVVTIPSGQSTLTIRFAAGRAGLSGVATLKGKPLIGGLAMLVPITIDQPGSITELRRDQTNTDGSFDIANIIPGQYILIAIDHGWNINWGDPSTLSHYLTNGVPLDLRTPTNVKQNIETQTP